MNSFEHNAHLSNPSPPSGAASTTSDLTLEATFNSLGQASPYTTSQNSLFAQPRPDPWYLETGRNDWELDTRSVSHGSFVSDEQPYLQPEKHLFASSKFPPLPLYDTSPCGHIESENFAETTLGPNVQPPPYQSPNYQ